MATRERTDAPAKGTEPQAQPNPSQQSPGVASASASRGKAPGAAVAPDPGMLADFAGPTPGGANPGSRTPVAAQPPVHKLAPTLSLKEPDRPEPPFTLKGPDPSTRFLVVVESPSKAKTISGYLEKDLGFKNFKVLASAGHITDLPGSSQTTRFGVDTDTWTPEFEVSLSKERNVHVILDAAKKVDAVYIASDPDREGEAIAWHVREALKKDGVDPMKVGRVTWGAITPADIKKGLAAPRPVNTLLVKAQVARRVVDRMDGYTMSSYLKKSLRPEQGQTLSAGRVQSAALKLVVDRDKERANHIPISYGAVSLVAESGGKSFKAALTKAGGLAVVGPDKEGKPGTTMLTQEAMAAFTLPKAGDKLFVISAETKPGRTAPKAPFTTTTLQIAAANALGLSPEETMAIAQVLYEKGRISYMRTDHPMVPPEAAEMARAHISEAFGKDYLPAAPRQYKAKGDHTQEAHPCIHPTHLEAKHAAEHAEKMAEAVAAKGPNATKLYDLITRRFLACQMADKTYDSTVAHLGFGAGDKSLVFKTNGNVVTFDGFSKVFSEEEGEESDPKKEAAAVLPPMEKGGSVVAQKCDTTMKKTTPKPAFTEATLVQAMEEEGIGRPSTFAATLATNKARGYTDCKAEGSRKNVLTSTDLGRKVLPELEAKFQKQMNLRNTAEMEVSLDKIASGELAPAAFLDESYKDLQPHLSYWKPRP